MRNLFYLFFILINVQALGVERLVKTDSELKEAINMAKPGDEIVLANGVWSNTEILFSAEGTEKKPIVLRAQENGKVFIEKQSNLRISGQYLVVKGLVFRNGFSPTSELISFKKDAKNLAYNCRLTEVVIDNFNGPERYSPEAWVVLYGKNNRVDHCQFIDKRNQGVTLTVRLNSPESVENKHLIDHNYFGFRQNLGSNGGETLRIGTSHYSMMNSRTIVEFNYFDRCDGEHEIISNKSNQNTYRYNTFFECQGTLTMRHGNETLVEGNIFLGNGKAFTGGIRIINESQTVINNYCEGLTGNRFRGALTIMNGVPNSPLNRYVPVKNSVASNNTFVNCSYIELCAGSDAERSQAPQSTTVENNLFYQSQRAQQFGLYDDISGISFKNNLVNQKGKMPTERGFKLTSVKAERDANGLLYLTNNPDNVGAKLEGKVTIREITGVSWYPKEKDSKAFGIGKVHDVPAGLNTLSDAVAKSKPGDILNLTGGSYQQTKLVVINHTLSIISSKKSEITYENAVLFTIENGGSLLLKGLTMDGRSSLDSPLNSVISTSKYSMNQNYRLFIEDCEFKNLDVNHSFNVLKVAASTFADTISVKNSLFKNVTGSVLLLDRELDDIGIYNAETVIIENSVFEDVEGSALSMYRGGSDESTTAGFLEINHCQFKNVGHGTKNPVNSSINLWGIQNTEIKNSLFVDAKPIKIKLIVGEPSSVVHDICLVNTGKIQVEGEGFSSQNIYESASSCVNGDDGKPLGIIK